MCTEHGVCVLCIESWCVRHARAPTLSPSIGGSLGDAPLEEEDACGGFPAACGPSADMPFFGLAPPSPPAADGDDSLLPPADPALFGSEAAPD